MRYFAMLALTLAVALPLPSEAASSNGQDAFMQAAKNAKPKIVSILLAKGANVDTQDANGKTALYWAAYLGHEDVAKVLLDNGANVNIKDRTGSTPLIEAAREGRLPLVKLLLDNREVVQVDYRNLAGLLPRSADPALQNGAATAKFIEIDLRNRHGNTAIGLAAAAGREAVVALLLDKKASLVIRNNVGLTPRDLAAEKRQANIVQLIDDYLRSTDLVRKIEGAAVQGDLETLKQHVKDTDTANLADPHGITPLMKAAGKNHLEPMRYLLQTGAYRDARDEKGSTALLEAIRAGAKDAVALLLNFGADPDMHAENGETALSVAKEKNAADIVGLLQNHAAYGKWFIAAAATGNTDEVKRLIGLGACLDCRDENGNVPLIAAIAENQPKTAHALLEAGADPNVKNANGETPLQTAARECSPEILQMLLAAKANPTDTDNVGFTALKIAFENKLDGEAGCSESFDLMKNFLAENSLDYQLIRAAELGNLKLVKDLLDSGADPAMEDEFDMTALAAAAKEGHVELIPLLAAKGSPTDGALLLAAENNRIEAVKALLAAKADMTGALAAAASVGNTAIIELLLQNGAIIDEDFKDEAGYSATPLILSATGGHTDAALALLRHGADAALTDSEGKTAEDTALRAGKADTARAVKEFTPAKPVDAAEDGKRRSPRAGGANR